MIWAARDSSSKNYTFNYEALKAANEDCQMRSDWLLPICTGAERLKNGAGRKTHPTQKPEALLARVILSASKPAISCSIPSSASGTTGAVAKRLGRDWLGLERDDRLCGRGASAHRRRRAVAAGRDRRRALETLEPRIAFASLVEAGLIAPASSLTDAKKRHSAMVRADGTLSLSGFVGSIHKTGALAQGLPACNGWTFWHYEQKGALAPIDDLRSQARERLRIAAE